MNRFRKILYVLTASDETDEAFQFTVHLAEKNKASLTILTAIERIPPYLTKLTPHLIRQNRLLNHKRKLAQLTKAIPTNVQFSSKIIEGKPFLEIIKEVLREGHDLVVKSTDEPSGLSNRAFGPTELNLLRKCPVPVLLINSDTPNSIQRVMAAIDPDNINPGEWDCTESLNQEILKIGWSLATLHGGEFHVAHAWLPVGEKLLRSELPKTRHGEVKEYLSRVDHVHSGWLDFIIKSAKNFVASEAYDSVTPQRHLVKGAASTVIPALAVELNIDVLVMGTVARTGISDLLIGNTAENILGEISCSVLAIKPAGFVSSVTLEADQQPTLNRQTVFETRPKSYAPTLQAGQTLKRWISRLLPGMK